MTPKNPEEFDWSKYDDGYNGSTRLIPNKSINGSSKQNKCFSREPYAQKIFDIYTNQDSEFIRKDLKKGDIVPVINIFNPTNQYVDIELKGGLIVTIDLTREKKFIQVLGYNTSAQFIDDIKNKEVSNRLIRAGLNACILEANPSVKISLWQGHLKSVRDEFMEQIQNPTKAYIAKVVEANKGGFFVEVQGLDAFMPGSLAAPNKIMDFQSYVGKEIVVMIEDFLKEMNSYIVSHKKYLAYILPIKIQELDLTQKYTGSVTGTSKYGIFVEFNELFTGLLHVSKMDEETKSSFTSRFVKSGDVIDFYISEITKDNRIILTKESPEDKLKKIQTFIVESTDKIVESTVAAVMNFGIIVSVRELNGLIPMKEMKKHKIMINNFIVGDKIKVMFDSYIGDKLIFKLPENIKA